VNRKPAILERFPDSEVMELDVFPRPEVRLQFPTDDWISQSAVQALADLEAASRVHTLPSLALPTTWLEEITVTQALRL
jgi:hypothetical protein